MSNAVSVGKDNFEAEVLQATAPVLVDFWAPWCGPCKMLGPVLDQIAAEEAGLKVCKVNVDDEQELAQRYQVMSIPTLLFFKDGKAVDTSVGFRPKEAILQMVHQ